MKQKCIVCGKEFEVKPYLVRQGYGKFCSSVCYGKWQSEHRRGENNSNWKPKIGVKCSYCNKELLRYPYLAQQEHHFCNRECFHRWQRETGFLAGEKNGCWMGGHKDYRGENWNKVRMEVLQRDNFTSQCCGAKEKLVVHHITPYHLFDNYKKANSKSNLITLCARCHQKIEKEFWDNHPELISKRRNPSTTLIRICEKCGKKFIPNSGSQRVCDECHIHKCLNCDKVFVSERISRKVAFCSRGCCYEYRRKNKN